MNKLRFVLKIHRKLEQQYSFLCEGWPWQFLFEDSQYCFESGMVISKNDIEGKQSNNVQEVHMKPFKNQYKIWGHLMI